MKRILICLALTFCCISVLHAQSWSSIVSLTGPCGDGPDDLKTFDNKLFIVGGFDMANDETSWRSCHWDGSNLIQHSAFLDGCGISALDIYHDSLFAVGGLQFNNGWDGQGVGVWNGSTWQTACDFQDGNGQYAIYADADDLYVGNWVGYVYKKNDNSPFSALSTPFEGPNQLVNAITKYNGSIIAAGYFTSHDGTTLNSIARWDGTTWQPLGTGVEVGPGLANRVNCLAVFNGELYAGGYFEFAGGIPARGIAKWNGTSWSEVGGSITSAFGDEIRDMNVIGNTLYVAGNFTQIGGVNTSDLASWNGTAWQDGGFNIELDYGLNSLEFYNNDWYVGSVGYGDTTHVYQSHLKTGASTPVNEGMHLSVFPNPSSGYLFVNFNADTGEKFNLEIYSDLGILVYQQSPISSLDLDLNFLPQGIYTLFLRKQDVVIQAKQFVVQR